MNGDSRPLFQLLRAGTLAAALASTSAARAFCRTTTCDPRDPTPGCILDAHGCAISGLPLRWQRRCLTFAVEGGGSPRHTIDHDVAVATIAAGYREWLSAECEYQGSPAVDVQPALEPLHCAKREYDPSGENTNVWLFRDDDWPFVGSSHQLALTTLTFVVATGEILDADVEINGADHRLTAGDREVADDLRSIATHEIGHFFGLSHSLEADATMNASYLTGSIAPRTLAPDDIAAICESYPAESGPVECGPGAARAIAPPAHCEPAGTASASDTAEPGGCALSQPDQMLRPSAAASIGALIGLLRVLRRRRVRTSQK